MGIDALELGYLNFDHPGSTDFRRTRQRCIACGACAANCPMGAMRMEDRGKERILSLCGTILNRQPLVFCDHCGAIMGPQRYLDYIDRRTRSTVPPHQGTSLCEACARQRGPLCAGLFSRPSALQITATMMLPAHATFSMPPFH